MKKRFRSAVIISGIFFVILFILIGLLCFQENQKKKGKKAEDMWKEQSEDNAVNMMGFEMLEPYIGSEHLDMLNEKICGFISTDKRLDSVKTITCKDVFETENKINFYAVFDIEDQIIYYAEYDKNSGGLFQYTEETTQEEAQKNWTQKKQNIIETKDWEEEKELPEEWTYIEDDPRELSIENIELLSESISEKEQLQFEESLMGFLKENSEYRREIFIRDVSLKKEKDHIEFLLGFKTERIDRKVVRAYMEVQTEKWTFELVEGGE